jgi:hypothetical protein
MIFHYAGKYDGDESKLPQKEHHPHAVPFKETEDIKKLSLIINIGCVLSMVLLAIPFVMIGIEYIRSNAVWMMIAGICGALSLFPHEMLHAMCYKEDVYMYNDLAHGLMFVIGTEDMSKSRFIFMCLCPNLFLGIIPYILFLCFPNLVGLGLFGILCTGMGFGDYLNIYNAMKQMPKGSKAYLCGMHSYWHL